MTNLRISIVLSTLTLASLGAQHTAHAFFVPFTQRLFHSHTLVKTRHGASLKPDKVNDGVETVNLGTISETFDPFHYANDEKASSHTLAESIDIATTEDIQQMGIWAARALLLFVAMLWGTNFAAVKYLETLCFHPPCNHPPSQAAFARFGVAALVSLPLLIGQRKDIILAGLECGLWVTLGYITQATALEYIPSGQCAFICSLTVVTVPLFAYFIFGKPLKGIHFISAIIALTGVGVLEGVVNVNDLLGMKPAIADTSTAVLASATTGAAAATEEASSILGELAKGIGISKGDLLALGQPLGFGLSFMRIEYYVEKFKDTPNRILTISAAQCVAVGFCSLLWLLYDFQGTLPNFHYMLDYHRLVAVLWTGIVTTVFAIYLQGVALGVASATEASLTFSTEPVWASLFGAWLLKEQIDATTYVGGSIILMGCILGSGGILFEGETEITENSKE